MTTFEEATGANHWTALSMYTKQNMRVAKAKQAADYVLHFLREYILEDRFPEAHYAFMKAMYEAEVEVVPRAQMAELERCRDAVLDKAKMEALLRPITTPAIIPGDPPPR